MIGGMSAICRYCKALKFIGEPKGLCCAGGKIKLPPLVPPPEPLCSLVSGTSRYSAHFLTNIQKYNKCFQMTSFGATHIVRNFVPTFKNIKEKCEKEAKANLYTLNVSSQNQNRMLNRYRDVNPYDHSRITINRGKVDYINANLVKLHRANRKYILTQGPLKDTVGHFWLMIWEQNSKAIVMLNKLLEKNQIKCHMYWPEKIGSENSLHMNDIGLSVEYKSCEEYANFSKRSFRLTDTESQSSREIIQFHYTTWPDFGIPSSPVAFLQFLKRVRESGVLEKDVGPAVIHCSAGIGRSGTFCLVDSCLIIVENENKVDISVQEILFELRKYRMGLIQTADQLYFSYKAIIEGIKFLKDPNFNNYEEVLLKIKDSDEDMLEIPPPLPPRIQSLSSSSMNKPLPTIPSSESVCDDLVVITNISEYKDASANGSSFSLEASYEVMTDSGDNVVTDVEITTRKTIESAQYNEDIDEANGDKIRMIEETRDIVFSKNEYISPNEESTDNAQLRRRKRVEKQIALQTKIQDIKRKHREMDEKTRMSEKRKKIFKYIMAGVIAGSICVYVYSKLS